MKDNLSKHYGILNAKERINLSIAALARGDEEEFLKLKNNCTIFHYKMPDANYISGMERITLICMGYAYLCDSQNNKAGMCYLLASLLEELAITYEKGFNLALEDLGNSHKPSRKTIAKKTKEIKKYKSLAAKLTGCFQERAAELKAVYEAFKSFCEKSGINYQYAYGLAEQVSFFDLPNNMEFEDVDIDMEFKEYIEQIFLKLWNK
jgi:hypothetical protein